MTMTLDRAELLRVCMLVRPALATGDYVPAYQQIEFKKGYATTYNDVTALSVRCKVSFERCVPGDLLARTIGSFSTKEISAVFDEAKNALVLSSGRSKIKLPTMPVSAFPFQLPTDEAPSLGMPKGVLTAIEQCLRFVGKDEAHPARMGVTLQDDSAKQFDGFAYSTDGVTITRARCIGEVTLPADVPVILPTFFCEQMVKLHEATKIEPVLYFLSGALLAEFNDEATVYSKTLVDIEPLEFDRIVAKLGTPSTFLSLSIEIPDALDGAIERSLLVLAAETKKTLHITINDGEMLLDSSASGGESGDAMVVDKGLTADCKVNPALLARALKFSTRIAFVKKAVVLMNDDASFLHIISHVVE